MPELCATPSVSAGGETYSPGPEQLHLRKAQDREPGYFCLQAFSRHLTFRGSLWHFWLQDFPQELISDSIKPIGKLG